MKKMVWKKKILEIHIDNVMKGVQIQKITFCGEGDQEPRLKIGDNIIVLDQSHAVFA